MLVGLGWFVSCWLRSTCWSVLLAATLDFCRCCCTNGLVRFDPWLARKRAKVTKVATRNIGKCLLLLLLLLLYLELHHNKSSSESIQLLELLDPPKASNFNPQPSTLNPRRSSSLKPHRSRRRSQKDHTRAKQACDKLNCTPQINESDCFQSI